MQNWDWVGFSNEWLNWYTTCLPVFEGKCVTAVFKTSFLTVASATNYSVVFVVSQLNQIYPFFSIPALMSELWCALVRLSFPFLDEHLIVNNNYNNRESSSYLYLTKALRLISHTVHTRVGMSRKLSRDHLVKESVPLHCSQDRSTWKPPRHKAAQFQLRLQSHFKKSEGKKAAFITSS